MTDSDLQDLTNEESQNIDRIEALDLRKEIAANEHNSLHCPKCGQTYALRFGLSFFCLQCDEHKILLQMIYSLKQQLDCEIEQRFYSNSEKCFTDFANTLTTTFHEHIADFEKRFKLLEIMISDILKLLEEIKHGSRNTKPGTNRSKRTSRKSESNLPKSE